MSTSGDVELTILDGGGAVTVPSASLQVVIGTSSQGTVGQVVATRSIKTLIDTFGYGPLVEAASLVLAAGGTVLAMKATSNALGTVLGSAGSPLTITAASNATPIVITATAHGLVTGQVVTVAGVTGNTAANGTFVATVLSANTFSLDGSVGSGAYVSGGTATPSGVLIFGGTSPAGTAIPTLSGNPYDTYNVKLRFTTSGTIGTAGIKFQISLDAGRTYGPVISLGTALAYTIPQTGITLTFTTAKTVVADSTIQFSTVEPTWAVGGVQACLNALQASAYATTGWGSMHIVGPCSGANASTIQGYLTTLAAGKIFSRVILDGVDASPPANWGGAGQSEAAWMTAVMNDFSAVSGRRLCVAEGHYNMPSQIPNNGVTYRLRRSLGWSLAARQVQIPPQRHAGRVKDGSLQEIVVDPTNDPSDGFIYHDERLNPGFDGARFASARTRIKKKGFFLCNPNLMSDTGSVFTLLPLGNVMDIACGIVNEVGTEDINEDIRLNKNGTIFENEALSIEQRMRQALKDNMVATNMLSDVVVAVDRTNNVQATSKVRVAVTIYARGYILEEDIEIGFGSAAQAA